MAIRNGFSRSTTAVSIKPLVKWSAAVDEHFFVYLFYSLYSFYCRQEMATVRLRLFLLLPLLFIIAGSSSETEVNIINSHYFIRTLIDEDLWIDLNFPIVSNASAISNEQCLNDMKTQLEALRHSLPWAVQSKYSL